MQDFVVAYFFFIIFFDLLLQYDSLLSVHIHSRSKVVVNSLNLKALQFSTFCTFLKFEGSTRQSCIEVPNVHRQELICKVQLGPSCAVAET